MQCSMCHVPCSMFHVSCVVCLALMIWSNLCNNGFTYGYHDIINCNYLLYVRFFVDAYDIIGDLETFVHKNAHIFLDITYPLPPTWYVNYCFFGGLGRRLLCECVYVLHISFRTHVFWNIFWTHDWYDNHIGYLYYILSKVCFMYFLNVFLIYLMPIFISLYHVALYWSSIQFEFLHVFLVEYVHWISLMIRHMHTLWRLGLLDLSFHFGICCQWGRKFRGFSGWCQSCISIPVIYVYGMIELRI